MSNIERRQTEVEVDLEDYRHAQKIAAEYAPEWWAKTEGQGQIGELLRAALRHCERCEKGKEVLT